MTSKNLYSKLMKEDLKSRIWAVALIGLGFFFVFPVTAAFTAGSIKEAIDYEEAVREYAKAMKEWLSFESGMTVFLMMVMALICGMSSFSYLNSKSKVDFYHSIPVRRERLYLVNYLCGILIMAVPYAVTLFLGAVIAVSNGAQAQEIWRTAAVSYGLNLVYYILMYSTVIVAVMMTGNMVVSFLGVMVFSFVIPVAAALTAAYYGTFFQTYLNLVFERVMDISGHMSPLTEYIIQVSNYGRQGVSCIAVLVALAAAVLLAVLGGFLYTRRPSEAAGRAMAFARTKPVIRGILTVIAAQGLGLFFWSMRHSTGWAIFGILCGGIIVHCVIEIIYHFDFKKLFANGIQLAGCLAVSLLILLIFRYDWFGYDRYLPKENQVKEAAVDMTLMNNWTSYGGTESLEDGTYEWKSIDSEDYVFAHMKLSDVKAVLDLAEAGIEENKSPEELVSSGYQYTSYGMEDEDGDIYTHLEIQYTLNSGRHVYRRYLMPVEKYRAQLEALTSAKGYKEGMFPVLSLTPEQVAGVRYRELEPEVSLNQMTMEEKAGLLAAYQQDFKEQTLEQMSKEMPVGLIRFVRTEDAQGIAWREQMEVLSRQHNTYFNDYSDIYERDFYPVYQSFARTCQILEKYGIEPGDDLDGQELSSISVRYYGAGTASRTAEKPRAVIKDPKEIEILSEIIKPGNFHYYNRLFRVEDEWDGEITFVDNEAKIQGISVVFPKGQVPDFLKERLTKAQ